jgi:hypothetical protein
MTRVVWASAGIVTLAAAAGFTMAGRLNAAVVFTVAGALLLALAARR